MASIGFWRPERDRNVKLAQKNWTQRAVVAGRLTQLGFLHEELCEGPADSSDEGCQQHHDEALHVELGRVERKHKEPAGDEQNHQDQEGVLDGQSKG